MRPLPCADRSALRSERVNQSPASLVEPRILIGGRGRMSEDKGTAVTSHDIPAVSEGAAPARRAAPRLQQAGAQSGRVAACDLESLLAPDLCLVEGDLPLRQSHEGYEWPLPQRLTGRNGSRPYENAAFDASGRRTTSQNAPGSNFSTAPRVKGSPKLLRN